MQSLDLLNDKENLEQLLLVHKNKIFEIETQILDINKKLATFSDNLILENLELSNQQHQIVNANEDYILVVACPGSGKTHTLISRYIKLILNNVIKPHETLLITFTKKAGVEMSNRLNKIISSKDSDNRLPFYIGSLHGLSYKVLQDNNENTNKSFIILDEKDSKELLKYLITTNKDTHSFENLSEEIINLMLSNIQTVIDQASTIFPFDIKAVLKKLNLDKYYKQYNFIYKSYQQKKKKENLLDFNDLMVMFCKYLDSDKSNEFKNNIKYVFFDEYQDVNPIQNYILSKFAEKSKIMVVGDDAQAIYSFRGSSVKYILNFDQNFSKESKMYLLEENYRSTPHIVNFCQDIINHNTNQFKKHVISKQDKEGLKPSVIGFKTKKDQYKWITDDIIKKTKEGIKLSQMVILSRKNNLLNDIELHLVSNRIPIMKHIGLSLLNKSHIKDFLAFITLLINPKSSIHWKRILCLHENYSLKKINQILENDNDILSCLKKYIDSSEDGKDLLEFYNLIINLRKNLRKEDAFSDSENNLVKNKIRTIINYLEKLWLAKHDKLYIIEYTNDINKLLNYLKESSLRDFINDLYLNQEIDIDTNSDNILYLTTIHGAKGLEWDYVYIIDVNSKDFPSIRPKYYLDELEEVDEERRLFYVACSRAKKILNITYYENGSDIFISPLLREINPELYNTCGVNIQKLNYSFNISKDIHNHIKYIGYYNVAKELSNLVNNKMIINKCFEYDFTINYDYLINCDMFIIFLIYKMIQNNFPNKIKKFDINTLGITNLNNNICFEYIDAQNDWRNLLENIFYISFNKCIKNKVDVQIYKDFLINESSFNYYLELEKGICKMINLIKPKEININYILSHKNVRGAINIYCDNIIIDIKPLFNTNIYTSDIVSVQNLSELLIYAFIFKKKEIIINKIMMYNPLNGELNSFDINPINLDNFKKIIFSK